MVIIPRGKPVLSNLNSYYLKLEQLLEHFQGELGSGEIYFHSSKGKGILYFDQHEVLEGYYQQKGKNLSGKTAIKFLLNPPKDHNFSINIHMMDEEEIYFWLLIPSAALLYDNLSSEFTDLEGLVKKMAAEKLTGYIEIAIGKEKAHAILFFKNGQISEDYYSWEPQALGINRKAMAVLLKKTKTLGGTFKVYQISMNRASNTAQSAPTDQKQNEDVLPMLSELLQQLEKSVNSSQKASGSFSTLLRKKFLQKADTYTYLDPFAGEFEYTSKGIIFHGSAEEKQLVKAVTECVIEMAGELGIQPQVKRDLAPWMEKYEKEIRRYAIEF